MQRRFSISGQDKISKIYNYIRKTELTTGHKPSNEEIAEELNIPLATVYELELAVANGSSLSLDTPIANGDKDETITIASFIPSPDEDLETQYSKNELVELVTMVLSSLPEKEAEVLRHRFGINTTPKTLEDVGQIYGVTRERIRQIENKAIRRIRISHSRNKLLKDYYN